jgi:soluble epoxide hydrolase / lipid-phosphate phosphatase
VISLGHDWGCGSAQRLYNFHADRILGLVMLNVAYIPPTPEPFDLDKVIEITTQFFGYGTHVSYPFSLSLRTLVLYTRR